MNIKLASTSWLQLVLLAIQVKDTVQLEILEHKELSIEKGIQLELVHEILYDHYIPVLYEIKVPSWTIDDLTIPIHDKTYFNACDNDNFQDSWRQFNCPVMFHMNKVVQEYSKQLGTLPIGHLQDEIQRIPSCFKIEPHFIEYSVLSETTKTNYITQLNECSGGNVSVKSISTPVSTNYYAKMLQRFVEVYITKTYYSNHERMAALTNAYGIFQSAQLMGFVSLKARWNEALASCGKQMIPSTLVTPETLNESITDISKSLNLTGKKYELSLSHIEEYFSLPLADCTFTDNKNLLIRIQVPLRSQQNSGLKSFKVKPIPFLKRRVSEDGRNVSEICEFQEYLGDLSTLRLVSEDNVNYSEAECNGNSRLCLIPVPVRNRCIRSLLSNNSQVINEVCPLTCTEVSESKQLPYFRQVLPDMWIVLGDRTNNDIFISCQGKPVKILGGVNPKGTTVQVTLPCGCQLVHQGNTYHSSQPCGHSLVIQEIVHHSLHQTNDTLNFSPSTNSFEGVESTESSVFQSNLSKDIKADDSLWFLYSLMSVSLSLIAIFLTTFSLILNFRLYKRIQQVEYSQMLIEMNGKGFTMRDAILQEGEM